MNDTDAAPLPAEISALTFEQALEELERIVRAMETGNQTLEDSIAAYERGTLLQRHCEAKLANVETRIAAIVQGPQGATGTRSLDR